MLTPLDTAISTAAVAEATYLTRLSNRDNIKAAIASATSPLPDAEAQVFDGAAAFNSALQALAAQALSSVVDLPPAPPPAVVVDPGSN